MCIGAVSHIILSFQYIDSLEQHNVVGGPHPWYVFRGHPVPMGSENADSLVSYKHLPTPWAIQTAFAAASPNPLSTDEILLEPEPKVRPSKERGLFVNAQWAFGGPGTGAPVRFCFNFLVTVMSCF
jgi:hypothetical protein